MVKRNGTRQQVQDETVELKNRLEETEETIQAIRQYLVDAFVVNHSDGTHVVTLGDADFPYRLMVESMNEGAVTLIPDGTIFYCNPRFSEMVQFETETLIGVRFQDLILPDEQNSFEEIFRQADEAGARGEFRLKKSNGSMALVQLSFHPLGKNNNKIGMSMIATDITERVEAEEKIRSLASKLTMAEQEERHRISQILHDDLQQHLFAIKAQLSLLRSAGGDSTAASVLHEDIDEIEDWLSRAISITRNLSIDLSPMVPGGEGLSEAIRWLSSQMREQHGLEVEIEAKEDFPNLDDRMRVLLFQAVRELLFNIVKHAGTLKAIVTLEQVDQHASITICDEGKGFDVDTVMNNPKLAHGLLVMQDRLGLIGCNMEIISTPGNGTKITLKAPQE